MKIDEIGDMVVLVDMAARKFYDRWALRDLAGRDLQLYVALDEQQSLWHEMLNDMNLAGIEEHGAAMARGWQAAVEVMEEREIDRAKEVFPGVQIVAQHVRGVGWKGRL